MGALQQPPLPLQLQPHQLTNLSSTIPSNDLAANQQQPKSKLNISSSSTVHCTRSMALYPQEQKPQDARLVYGRKENDDTELSRLASTLPGFGAFSFMNSSSQLKLEDGQCNLASNSTSRGARSSPTTTALTAQGALGAASAKVSKRRSRATSKSPITVLSADTTNFRAMVQKLTGIPTSPSMQRNGFQFLSNPSMSVLKPCPSRPPHSIHGLPTLDTSAFLLLDGANSHSQSQNILHSFANYPLLQSARPLSDSSNLDANLVAKLGLNRPHLNPNSLSASATSDLKSFLPSFVGNATNLAASRASLPSLWDPAESDKFKGKCFTDRLKDNAYNEEKIGGRADSSKHVSYQGMIREADQFGLQM